MSDMLEHPSVSHLSGQNPWRNVEIEPQEATKIADFYAGTILAAETRGAVYVDPGITISLGQLGTMLVKRGNVKELPTGPETFVTGHIAYGALSTPQGETYYAELDITRRSLLARMLKRPVRGHVKLEEIQRH